MVIPEIRIELLSIAEWLDEYAKMSNSRNLAKRANRLRKLETELSRISEALAGKRT
jgi:hypothetical protein